ncbi:MAG: hypothetical protein HQL73_06595 [Magnetococcales bacterium]|nr:hypothetical protein [Magnetococcales bacterium]
MIKIEIIGPNGENLLNGSLMERVKKLGLPAVGLAGGMVLSFFLASSLVTDRTDKPVELVQDRPTDTYQVGTDYSLPVQGRETASGSEAVVGKMDPGTYFREEPGMKYGAETTQADKSGSDHKKLFGNLVSATHSKDLGARGVVPKKNDGVSSLQAQAMDPMLDERIHAAQEWLTAGKNDGSFSIQLMSVRRSNLGGLKQYLAKANLGLEEDKLYAFPVAKDRLLLYYGRYASYNEAVQAIASLPVGVRSQKPFVLSGKDIQGKLAQLNRVASKKEGLVAALKP